MPQVLTFIVSGVLLGAFFYGKLTDGANALQVRKQKEKEEKKLLL